MLTAPGLVPPAKVVSAQPSVTVSLKRRESVCPNEEVAAVS